MIFLNDLFKIFLLLVEVTTTGKQNRLSE